MRNRPSRRSASPELLAGLLVAVAGSFADNLLGGGVTVTVVQVTLWAAGGVLLLAGVAAAFTLGAGQRAERAHEAHGTRSAMHPSSAR